MAKTRDYLAEMYVAGVLADAGWNIYFPHRDMGFDFIITKHVGTRTVIRPVQVKGKYPQHTKTDKNVYGYRGKLSQVHDEMVLAIPFFPVDTKAKSPVTIAYVPLTLIKKTKKGFRCDPAKYIEGTISARKYYRMFFDSDGIAKLENSNWKKLKVKHTAA
jgi:hypothetical protein